MKSAHIHLWGSKGRPPRRGDLCLTCPQEWTPRVGGYRVNDYKPRTERHVPLPAAVLVEAAP